MSKPSRIKNLGLAAIAAQAGCATLIIVFVALFAGLWLDAHFGQRGPFTFGLLILSVPFSLYLMLRIALGAINRLERQPPQERPEESTKSEEV
ncbi:MAG: AtpZ/AtpI family protein [Anaerolineae bacterium]|nr:AtpZ/AtpI family protein [Anaerolineae bacterium]